MKKTIKRTLQFFFNPIAKILSYDIAISEHDKLNKNALLKTCFLNLKLMGFNPKHIMDIGANRGTWTRETLKYFPDAFYSLLEPQSWLKKSLQDILDKNSKVQFFPVGAGEVAGSFKFTIMERDDSCSFRYTAEEAKNAGYKQIDIPVTTINNLVAQSELPFPDLVKIDAEGLDIKVLKGASTLFGKTEVFMVEAGVFNKEFDNSFLKIINFMNKNGYRLFEITDLNRPFSPNVLWLVELVFIKKNGIIDTYQIST